ncbi:hypothetical protein UFOVP411_22 [uncultured Caudovirales phage]|uniref:Exonuclease n=1 Tax=uncultured Caudovirales phage TaxID=2100421 RepID=A0A6J5M482_9CAUD|nr:hypothetical protein UFOVP411_22 [uncultured Caudovirales phage]
MPRTALIDGDILAYRIGFASQDVEERHAVSRLRETVLDIAFQGADADRYRGFLSPRGPVFRHRIATLAPYKGTRKQEKPIHFDALRAFMHDRLGFEMAVDEEADDLIGIEAVFGGDDTVICTLDKDLDMIPGWHYNFAKRETRYIGPEEALANFYRQILTGDTVDNIPGLYHAQGIKCGPVMAEGLIPVGLDEKTMHEIVVSAYGGNEDMVRELGQLLWIRRYPGQTWEPPQ